ncbi:Actin cytoskeleton-regulatory complex pan-like protein [Quillaja saponaria]|uniref:Actin cytoskeleton-regulatory complex pan-like protein n=1 Tax=Quillaja saponaria TaxID=32244 RepID=A0AAD7M0I4_QUISA|nr:Actin cytoskeleton-regulatory complex pan-like protein [Quillaja saponaria]
MNRMNVSGGPNSPANPHRRKLRNKSFVDVLRRKYGIPTIPLLQWKLHENHSPVSRIISSPVNFREGFSRNKVSARKLAAGLWQMRFTEASGGGGEPLERGSFEGFFSDQVGSSVLISKCSMEGATKWDPRHYEASNEITRVYRKKKLLHNGKQLPDSVVSTLQAELVQAQICTSKHEAGQFYSKKQVEDFLRKLEEEKIYWKSRERLKNRAIVHDLKDALGRERKNREKLGILNGKLINELANAKLSAKKFLQSYEEEMKCRKLTQEVCNELAKKIGEDTAKVEVVKRELVKFSMEVEEERRMLQMAELLREERVQMKLLDAKLALEDKYYQMNLLIADTQSFLRSRSGNLDMTDIRKVKLIQQAAELVNIHNIKELSYDPSKSGAVISMLQGFIDGKANEEIEPFSHHIPASHSSRIDILNHKEDGLKNNPVLDQSNLSVDNIGSENNRTWETGSSVEDQDSVFSLGRNDTAVYMNCQRKTVSGSRMEHDENAGLDYPYAGVSEVCSVSSRQPKEKGSSMSKFRSCPSHGTITNVGATSQYRRSDDGVLRCQDYAPPKSSPEVLSDKSNRSSVRMIYPNKGSGAGGFRRWGAVARRSSPDSVNPHITRGIKGYIEWPRGITKSSLRANNLESRVGSQKSQLHHIRRLSFLGGTTS